MGSIPKLLVNCSLCRRELEFLVFLATVAYSDWYYWMTDSLSMEYDHWLYGFSPWAPKWSSHSPCLHLASAGFSVDRFREGQNEFFFHTKMDIFPSRFSKHLHSSTVCSFPWGHRSVDDFAVGWRVLGTFRPFHSQIVRCTELCVPVHWPNENISNLVKYQQILQITNIWVSETSGLPCTWVRYFR